MEGLHYSSPSRFEPIRFNDGRSQPSRRLEAYGHKHHPFDGLCGHLPQNDRPRAAEAMRYCGRTAEIKSKP